LYAIPTLPYILIQLINASGGLPLMVLVGAFNPALKEKITDIIKAISG